MARILIAEDDQKQAEIARSYLERDGHSVVVVADGREAIDEARRRTPDLVVLDLMMPRVDGLDVCRVLRAETSIPIVIVTARSTDDEVLLGFDLGADDYVTKPYSPLQLVARVRAVLRRSPSGSPAEPVLVGDLEIDSRRCRVRRAGEDLALTPTERTILETLAAEPGQVCSRRELLEAAFGFEHDAFERTIDTHISNLRRKIEDDPAQPRYLHTVKGRGYRLSEDTDAP